MMFYIASNTRPYIYFDVHQCSWFTHNNKASHETSMKKIFQYLQFTNDKCLMFNSSKKMVVDCDADADFLGMWVHENPQYTICDRSRTAFVVTFTNCPLLWVSKRHTYISLYSTF